MTDKAASESSRIRGPSLQVEFTSFLHPPAAVRAVSLLVPIDANCRGGTALVRWVSVIMIDNGGYVAGRGKGSRETYPANVRLVYGHERTPARRAWLLLGEDRLPVPRERAHGIAAVP